MRRGVLLLNHPINTFTEDHAGCIKKGLYRDRNEYVHILTKLSEHNRPMINAVMINYLVPVPDEH